MVRPEKHIEKWSQIRKVVSRSFDTGVMPMMELRCAEDPFQGSQRDAYIGMHENRPDRIEDDESRYGLRGKTKQKRRQIHRQLGQDSIHRVFSMGCNPIEVFTRMMHGVKSPQEIEAVTGPVKPIHA